MQLPGREQVGIANHAEHRGGRRKVVDVKFGKRFDNARRVELAGIGADMDAQCEGRDGAVPQAVAPGRRGRAEIAVARLQPHAIQRGDHQRHDRAVRMPHRFGQLARGARGVLENGQIVGARVRVERRALGGQFCPKGLVHAHDFGVTKRSRDDLPLAHQQQARCAIIDAQCQPFRAEQRKQRHADRAALHRTEQRHIEAQRGLKHHRHTLALADTAPAQPVGEAPGQVGEPREVMVFKMAVCKLDAHRAAAPCMPVQALVRQVHALGIAVEQFP